MSSRFCFTLSFTFSLLIYLPFNPNVSMSQKISFIEVQQMFPSLLRSLPAFGSQLKSVLEWVSFKAPNLQINATHCIRRTGQTPCYIIHRFS